MLDFGYVQTTSTEHLKLCIHNEAVVVEPTLGSASAQAANALGKLSVMSGVVNPRTVPSNAVHRPVNSMNAKNANAKNEIFVDILEKITVLLNANG